MVNFDENKISRVCIIDDKKGRIYDRDKIKANLDIQDDGQTLKIFVNLPDLNNA